MTGHDRVGRGLDGSLSVQRPKKKRYSAKSKKILASLIVILMVANGLFLLSVARSNSDTTQIPNAVRMIVPADELKGMEGPVKVIVNYGAFALVEAPKDYMELRLDPQATPVDYTFHFNAGDFVIQTNGAPAISSLDAIPSEWKLDSYGTQGDYLIQFVGPVKKEWVNLLEENGVYIEQPIQPYGYIVSMDSSKVDTIKSLEDSNGVAFVNYVGIYQPYWKVSMDILNGYTYQWKVNPMIAYNIQQVNPNFKNELVQVWWDSSKAPAGAPTVQGNMKIIVKTYSDVNDFSRIVTRMDNYNAKVVSSNVVYHKLIVEVSPDNLYNLANDLAKMPEIYWIEIQPQYYVMNVNSHWVGQSYAVEFYPAYYWDVLPLWSHGIWGQGQIVGVTDSGIDIDNIFFRDVDSNGDIKYPGPDHRKVIGYRINSNSAAYDDDIIGHGTHVCGSIAGDRGTIGYPDPFDGMAPLAKITFDDAGDPSSPDAVNPDVPGDYQQQYADGARIHSNSWGTSSNSYGSNSADTDAFMWDHKDDLILFAAGNSGPGANTVGDPGTAKDIITVGAAVNWINEQMADFSSHGPVDDGRLKPTIAAPGVWIESADSDAGVHTWNSGFLKMDGTSMATPTMAGFALLTRQYYTDGFYPTGAKDANNSFIPSGDLIKATMVNSAWDMAWEYTGDAGKTPKHIPSNGQGWGKVNLDNALYFQGDSRKLLVLRNGLNHTDDFTSSGQSHTYHIHVGDGEYLKITLAWTDYQGPTSSNPDIINDLNLVVTAPDGTQYLGNVFSNGFSTTGGSADNLNTVEQVLLPANLVQPGEWTIQVVANNIQQSPQPYALVVTGDLYDRSYVTATDRDSSSENIVSYPHFQMEDITNVPPVDTQLNIVYGDWSANTDSSSADTVSVTVDTGKDSETVTLTETGANTGIFTGSIPLEESATGNSGDGTLQVSDGDVIHLSTSNAQFNVTVDASAPKLTKMIIPYDDHQHVDDNKNMGDHPTEGNWTFNTRLGTHYAILDFTTDEETKAIIKYGDSPDKLWFTESWDVFTKNHSVALFNLDSSTWYYFKVIAMDRAGNIATFDNNGALYAFRTLDGVYQIIPGYSGYIMAQPGSSGGYGGSSGPPQVVSSQFINKPMMYSGRYYASSTTSSVEYLFRSLVLFDASKYQGDINNLVGAEMRLFYWGGIRPTRSGDATPWPWYLGVMPDNNETAFTPGQNPDDGNNNQGLFDYLPPADANVTMDDFTQNQGNNVGDYWYLNDTDMWDDFINSISNDGKVLFKYWTKDDGFPTNASLGSSYKLNLAGLASGHNDVVFQGYKLYKLYAPEIRFYFHAPNDGYVMFDRDYYDGTDWAHITVWDAGANTDPNAIDTVQVTVKDSNTGDIETITLNEVDENAGVFYGTIKLTYGDGHPDTSGGQTENSNLSGDLTLQVQDGDTIEVTYTDPDPSHTASDTATVGSSGDTTAPTISNVGVTTPSNLAQSREEAFAVIQWDTDEPASSIVRWGSADGNYGGIATGYGEWETHHLVVLEDLPRGVTIYYTIVSYDKSGNEVTQTGSFTTAGLTGVGGSSYHVHTGAIVYDVGLSTTIVDKSGDSYNPTTITLTAKADDGVYNDGNGTTSGYQSWVYVHNARAWLDGKFPITVSPTDGAYDNRIENLTATIDVTNLDVGVHYITIQAQGPNYTWGPTETVYFFVRNSGEDHIIYGYVTYPDGSVAANAQVNVTINGQTVTVQTDSTGFYRADITGLSYSDGDIVYVNATYFHAPYTDFGTDSTRIDTSVPWQQVDVVLKQDALVPELFLPMMIVSIVAVVAAARKLRDEEEE